MSKKDDYAALLVQPAFLELMAWAKDQGDISMRAIDSVPAKELSVNQVCEARGYRAGLIKIFQQAEYMKTQS